MKRRLFFLLFLLCSQLCYAQDSASFFLGIISVPGNGHVYPVHFPNDSIDVFFFGENSDTATFDLHSSHERHLSNSTTLLFHDSIVGDKQGWQSIWEFRFPLGINGPHYVGLRLKNKRNGQWSDYKIFCGQPDRTGSSQMPYLVEFRSGNTTTLNDWSSESPGMPVSRNKAIHIAQIHGCYKNNYSWQLFDIRYIPATRCWHISSVKSRTSHAGSCKHCNGYSIVHTRSILIDATNGKVV